MPWGAKDAKRHTKKARTAKQQRQWSHVANSELRRGASEGQAVRAANAVVKRGSRSTSSRGKRKSRRR